MKGIRRVLAFAALALITCLPGLADSHFEVSPTVGGYILVECKIVGAYKYLTFRAQITNPFGHTITDVRATLSCRIASTTVVDGTLNFPDVPPGATVTSSDTFTIRLPKSLPFDPLASGLVDQLQEAEPRPDRERRPRPARQPRDPGPAGRQRLLRPRWRPPEVQLAVRRQAAPELRDAVQPLRGPADVRGGS